MTLSVRCRRTHLSPTASARCGRLARSSAPTDA
jgi:hypothetical protein